MDLVEVFGKLKLDLLPNDWVTEIWNNQFSESSELPVEYEMYLESIPIRQLLNETCAAVKQWLSSSSSSEFNSSNSHYDTSIHRNKSDASSSISIAVDSKSWQILLTNSVKHKALLCLISTFIHQGKANSKNENIRQVCLGATNLYFMLIAIPGSKVYNIFNPVLYAHAIESLKVCSSLDPVSSSKPKSKKKPRVSSSDDSGDSDQSDNEVAITGSSKVILSKSLNVLLNDMLYLLKRFNFKDETDSLILTIQILVLITRLEKRVTNFLLVSPTQPSTTSLARNAYVVLKNVCDLEHGDVQETIKLIMRELLPSILVGDHRDTLISAKEASVIKDHSILFIKELLHSVKEPAYLGVKTLIQHLCVRLPDRAETRTKGVQVIHEVMNILPLDLYSQVIVWIMKLCHNDEVKNRITGLELVTKLLTSADKGTNSTNNQTSNLTYNECNSTYMRHSLFSTHKFLLATVFSRCKDASATVRAKSLSIIANLILSNNVLIKHEIESIFLYPYEDVESFEDNEIYRKEFFDMHNFLIHFDIEKAIEFDPLPGAKAVLDLLEFYADDPKVYVRKSALQVLANIFVLNNKWMTEKRLELLEFKCRDISVLVRKMLVQSLTELIDRYPSHPKLPTYWVRGVLPLLADQEIKSQEKVLEVLQQLVLKNFVTVDKMKKPHHYLPWKLLDLIGELKMHRHFVFACHKWTLEKILKQQTIEVVRTHVGSENNSAAWFFLSAVSEYMGIKDPSFVLEYFNQYIHAAPEIDEYCSQLVLEVIFLNWRQFGKQEQLDLCSQLLDSLYSYSIPLPLIARYMDICQFITENLATDKETGRERVYEWAEKLVKMSQKYLTKNIGPTAPEHVADEVLLAQHIFTLGEALQLAPINGEPSSLALLKNLLEPSLEHEDKAGKEAFWPGKVGATVKAVSVVTLGKMSLQREKTSVSLVPLFGILLSHSKESQIKINTMIALTDLCTKYTSVVEKLLPDMCLCLRDNDLSVKENTLRLIIQLVQEDYLKLRCPLLFHLLSMLLDENLCIRDMASVFFEYSVFSKHKNIMVQHFVEGLFHYNGYYDHPAYSKVVMDFKEKEAFSLAGPDKREKRRQIYKYMLENMMDDHRFRTTHNICTDVLGGVTEGKIKLNEQGTAVLQDALCVLSSSEIRLTDLRPKSKDDDDDGEEINVAQVITNIAKKTIISQVVKKDVIEHIVPVIIQLKHKLKQLKSPLVKDLMAYLRELMKDYKDEINDILAADKELADEVLLDLETATEDSSEEESGDELVKVVSRNEEKFRKFMMEAVVNVERLSSTFLAPYTNNNNNHRSAEDVVTDNPTASTSDELLKKERSNNASPKNDLPKDSEDQEVPIEEQNQAVDNEDSSSCQMSE